MDFLKQNFEKIAGFPVNVARTGAAVWPHLNGGEMTRNQLRLFCLFIISAFVLLYGAASTHRAAANSEWGEDELQETINKVERLESELDELEGKNERLELELSSIRQ